MVRSFTTVRPLKDFVSPSTSMTISGAAAVAASTVAVAAHVRHGPLGRRAA